MRIEEERRRLEAVAETIAPPARDNAGSVEEQSMDLQQLAGAVSSLEGLNLRIKDLVEEVLRRVQR